MGADPGNFLSLFCNFLYEIRNNCDIMSQIN